MMKIDFKKVFDVIHKGVGAIRTLIEQGKSAGPAITAVENLAESAKGGKVTEAQIASTEATLDALVDDFNKPL